jgi:murein DD-endopeptidase MepM/ murein hydrolase activator NlpD
MKKRRHKNISVLFVPDGHAEPVSFKFSMRAVRIIVVVAFLLVLHIIAGGVAYFRWYNVSAENMELAETNGRLLKDNRRIYQLEQQINSWSQEQEKLLGLMGVKNVRSSYSSLKDLATSGTNSAGIRRSTSAQPADLSIKPSKTAQSNIIRQNRRSSGSVLSNLPTQLPVKEGYLTGEFAPEYWLYGKRHFGIDIAANGGVEIQAAGDGAVIFAGWTPVLGNLIILHHGDDLFSFYGHNKQLLVNERTFVRKGDPIALLGNSGQSSGPHLHFEIWQNGKPVDPRDYLLAFQAN